MARTPGMATPPTAAFASTWTSSRPRHMVATSLSRRTHPPSPQGTPKPTTWWSWDMTAMASKCGSMCTGWWPLPTTTTPSSSGPWPAGGHPLQQQEQLQQQQHSQGPHQQQQQQQLLHHLGSGASCTLATAKGALAHPMPAVSTPCTWSWGPRAKTSAWQGMCCQWMRGSTLGSPPLLT